MTALLELAAPAVEPVGEWLIVRDDLIAGGTKRRFLTPLLRRWPEREFVYAGPAEGYGQLALAISAAEAGKRATMFAAARARPHYLTVESMRHGLHVLWQRPGYLSVLEARARRYAAERADRRLLPLGFDTPEVLDAAADVFRRVPQPAEAWITAGSGLLARAMAHAWPDARINAVAIGRRPELGPVPGPPIRLWDAPEEFARPAELPPPYPSTPHYDAKAWRFIRAWATPGALIWNVAA